MLPCPDLKQLRLNAENFQSDRLLAPLSVVILGGLLSSTFLNLIIVPAGYAAIHRVSAENPNPKTKTEN